MKYLLSTFIFVLFFTSLCVGQNRFFFQDGSYIDGKIHSLFGNSLTLTVKSGKRGVADKKVDLSQVTKILGRIDRSRKTLFLKKNPSIIFEEDVVLQEDEYVLTSTLTSVLFDEFISKLDIFSLDSVITYYRDGSAYHCYQNNGLKLTMTLWQERNYGKYYVAFLAVENYSGEQFLLDPKEFKAYLFNSKEIVEANVLTNEEYMKIVGRRQMWNQALVSFGEASMASNAGRSSSTTTINSNVNSGTTFNASGTYGSTYGTIDGRINSNTNSNSTITTNSVNGAAQYAASQQAAQNASNFSEGQENQKQSLNRGYLKINTVFNEESVIGQFNIAFMEADELLVLIPIQGLIYGFKWSLKE